MIVPKSRPQLKESDALKILSAFGEFSGDGNIVLLGIRGYYANTFGAKKANDREFYDDALFSFVGADFNSWNFNSDPFKYRAGIASLCCGIYDVVRHRHKGKYDAFQIVRDILRRDGSESIDVGRHGINLHYGSSTNTYSEGCQTMPKDQFIIFQPKVYKFMDAHNLASFRYILTSFS